MMYMFDRLYILKVGIMHADNYVAVIQDMTQ